MSNANGKSDVTPTESKTTGTVENFSHGSRETPATSASPMEADRSEKARSHKSDAHVAGESDGSIVPGKRANKTGTPVAESVEGREPPEGNVVRYALVPVTVPGTTSVSAHRTTTARTGGNVSTVPSQGKSRMR